MERFIIVIPDGDGYTYSAEITLPVVFSSKEELVITLEDTINTYVKNLDDFNKKIVKYDNKVDELKPQLIKISEQHKRSKSNSQLDEKFNSILAQQKEAWLSKIEFEKANKPSEILEVGGQQFYVHQFLHRDENKKFIVSIPQVFSLDEFFFQVENKLQNGAKIKP